MNYIEFKKGDYVVLLKSCNGENCWEKDLPENYCYQLSKDSIEEVVNYLNIGKPFKVSIDKIIEDYSYITKILKKYKIK